MVCRSGLLCWAGTLVCHACLPCRSVVLMSVGGGFIDMGGGCGGSVRPVPLQVPCDTKKAMLSLVCRSGLPRCIDMGGGCGGSARPVPLQVPCDTKKAMLSLVCRSGLPRWPGTLVCRACLPCWSAVLVCRACLCWVLDSSVIVFAFCINNNSNNKKPATDNLKIKTKLT